MSNLNRPTDRPTDAPTRFARIAIVAANPRNPAEHWYALGAYASELADLYGFTSPTHAASGRKVRTS